MEKEKIYVVFLTVDEGDWESHDVDYPLAYCKTEAIAKKAMQSFIEKHISTPSPWEEDKIKENGKDAFIQYVKSSYFIKEEPIMTEA